ncbi:MAG: response regulator [Thermodesulfobacteriota bacterium]
MQVFTASANGRDGIEVAREQTPRVAIIDLKLPDISGLDVIKKSLNELDQPPITIMITAHGYIEAAVSAMRLGAYDFVEKPFPWTR